MSEASKFGDGRWGIERTDLTGAPPEVSSAMHVIAVAARFCRSIGQPVSASSLSMAVAIYPSNNDSPSDWSYRRPLWEVELQQARVEVMDGSDLVVGYANYGTQFDSGPHESGGVSARALRSFWAAIRASGQSPMDVGVPTVTGVMSESSSSGEQAVVEVVSSRLYHGIPYYRYKIFVKIEAQTGQVDDFSLAMRAPAPTRDVQSVSAEQADVSASGVLARAGILGCQEMTVEG